MCATFAFDQPQRLAIYVGGDNDEQRSTPRFQQRGIQLTPIVCCSSDIPIVVIGRSYQLASYLDRMLILQSVVRGTF